MVPRTASIFSQLLKFFPRNEFAKIVKKHGAERSAKGFTSWSLSLMAAALRWNLFVYRDLRDWLDDPTAWDVDPPPIIQLKLAIPGIGQ